MHDHNYICRGDKPDYKKYSYKETALRNTYSWHTKADQIRQDSRYLCSVCLDEGIYNYNNLEIHHITKIKEDESKLLDNYNLVCLCSKHHKLADAGLIPKEYLLELAKRREET